MQELELDAAESYATLPQYAFCLDLPPRDDDEHERVRATGIALVAELDGAAKGFVLGLPIDGRAHILEIAVAKRFQGRGYGRTLLSAFERWAREAGFREATLTTFRDVPWNAPFYARLGYQAFAIDRHRPELQALRAAEKAAGIDRASRVAMRKPI
jgi:GNAT superfamily N-acetyltransferase